MIIKVVNLCCPICKKKQIVPLGELNQKIQQKKSFYSCNCNPNTFYEIVDISYDETPCLFYSEGADDNE